MIDRKPFFDAVRPKLYGGTLTQQQVDGLNASLDEWEKQALADLRWLAYMLATAHHETNATMAAVREAYWLSEDWRKTHLRYYPFYGRGLVQLTWRDNYKAMSAVTGVDLVANPDAALDLGNAVQVMFYGMQHGTFTGRKLSDYFGAGRDDPPGARAIINGTDKAALIAAYHYDFLQAIEGAS